MMRKTAVLAVLGVMLAVSAPPVLWAEEKAIVFHDTHDIAEALKPHVGQHVYLMLQSGKEIQGKLEKVGAQLVLLTKLSGKEFYDAAIRIDQIEGFQLKVRP
jgi:hypothetical protein